MIAYDIDHSFPGKSLANSAVNFAAHHGKTGEIRESTSEIHIMNLRVLHYSLINHHFHQSTITINPKINVNKLVTELL